MQGDRRALARAIDPGAVTIAVRRRHFATLGARSWLLLVAAIAIGGWTYANAWWRTGNPAFPFMNAFFRSPLFDTSQSFTNPMYLTPLRPWSLYEAIVDSSRFVEGSSGAAGFHWLLILPLIYVAFARRRPAEQWACAALAVVFFVAVWMQQSYLRYLLPRLRCSPCSAAGPPTICRIDPGFAWRFS